ncbi:MAG TPA: LemA family protein [Myxococcales bacterium]|jgi:LemA protein|nr:LemA family protein [Myxococcales bacterium]
MRMRKFAPLLVLALAGCGPCGYNRVVSEEQAVESAWSQVENQLQRRADLIPNLVEVVKGYARHEKGVFDDIANARAAMLGASSRADKIQTANQFEGAISKLMSISEAYPQLKADGNFQRLMDELAGSENRLAVERKRYNDAVQQYNTDIRGIPGAWWAKIGGFGPKEYFKAEAGAKAVPKVSFQ